MILDVIAEDKNLITYRPKLNKLTGSITATIVLQQILFRWKLNGSKEFYKFKSPCKHPDCKENDSWIEELGMTIYEFDSAYKKLKDLGLVSSRNTMDRKTFYLVNENLLEASISQIYLNGKNPDRKPEKTDVVNGENQDSITNNRDNTEITIERHARQKENYEIEKEIILNPKQKANLDLVFNNPLFEITKSQKFSNLTKKEIELSILQYAEGKQNINFNSFIFALEGFDRDKLKKQREDEMLKDRENKNKVWYGDKPKEEETFELNGRIYYSREAYETALKLLDDRKPSNNLPKFKAKSIDDL